MAGLAALLAEPPKIEKIDGIEASASGAASAPTPKQQLKDKLLKGLFK